MGEFLETKLPGLELLKRGKVRDIYDVPSSLSGKGPRLLLVATDRLSAFDVVMPQGIPQKGAVLAQISAFWFGKLAGVVPNHLVTVKPSEMPPVVRDVARGLGGRAMLVERAQVVPIECVVRGYLASSVEKAYKETGEIQGIKLPAGIPLGGKLPEPIFTPTTKAEAGHDVPLTFAETEKAVGKDLAKRLRDLTLAVFRAATAHCEKKGLLLADTKLEFGTLASGELALVDEVLTPDSSRFFKAAEHQPGRTPIAWDKQVVRDYLNSLKGWDKKPPGPALPPEIIEETARRYREVYEIVTGKTLADTVKELQRG
jgi:phosphoribosylaminoimidazole-succinocarboxamide synthase